ARYGLETTIADVDGTMRPLRDVAARMLAEARDVLRTDDLDAPLQGVDRLLADETSYARQRRLFAETGMGAVLDDLEVGAGEV
ncbi:MAG: hypothetical protein ACJ72D_11790, partial [Marmoricola sp.]